MNLAVDEFIEIILPLYGLTESGNYWCETFGSFHLHDLRMSQAIGDFSLFFRREADKLVAFSGTHVDDTLQAETTTALQSIHSNLRSRFDIRISDASKFIFTGILWDVSNKSQRLLSEQMYIKKLQFSDGNATFSHFRSLRAKIMWPTHTRHDVSCAASFASQITEKTFGKEAIKILNDTVKYL